MGWTQAIGLGLVQGLTEFLPVSSSGHLVLAKAVLGVETGGIVLEVALHFATFLAVVTMMYKPLGELLVGALRMTGNLFRQRVSFLEWWRDRSVRNVVFLAMATLPAVAVGFGLKSVVESLFATPPLAAGMLLATGGILWSTRFSMSHMKSIGFCEAMLVGLAQAAAIVPGISRSGATISAALHRGVEDRTAAEFSFLLSLPVIFGATLVEIPEARRVMAQGGAGYEFTHLAISVISAYVSGCVAIWLVFGALRRGRFPLFAYYCWGVGALGLVLTLGTRS